MLFRRRVAVAPKTVSEALEFMRQNPQITAVLSDFDGVLAPIVSPGTQVRMPDQVRSDLRRVQAEYRVTAVVTGRRAREAHDLVAVDGIHILGNFGSETLMAGQHRVRVSAPFLLWRWRVRQIALGEWKRNLRDAGAIMSDKGSVIVFSWRDVADEAATRQAVEAAAARAEAKGIAAHHGKKSVEFRPPVLSDKGTSITKLLHRYPKVRCAIYFGDDTIDIPAMNALENLVRAGKLDFALRVGVLSPETPQSVIDASNYAVNGTAGVAAVIRELATPL